MEKAGEPVNVAQVGRSPSGSCVSNTVLSGSWSLCSEDSQILFVPRESIQAGHIGVVWEAIEFIKGKESSDKRSWWGQIDAGSRENIFCPGGFKNLR
jgi:hypothetical protein